MGKVQLRGQARRYVCAVSASLFTTLMLVTPASASQAALSIDAVPLPTVFKSGEQAVYRVITTNTGAADTEGDLVTLTDQLPTGISPRTVGLESSEDPLVEIPTACRTKGQIVTCRYTARLKPDSSLTMIIGVTTAAGAENKQTNIATVSLGGLTQAIDAEPDQVDQPGSSFGPTSLEASVNNSNGTPETQAGGHPYELTARIDLATEVREAPDGTTLPTSIQDLRDLIIDLPAGLLGAVTATPTCTLHELAVGCPADTGVGHLQTEPVGSGGISTTLYNVVPEAGVPAEFGYTDVLGETHVIYPSLVPSASGYILQLAARELPQVPLQAIAITIYGNPHAHQHIPAEQTALLNNSTICDGSPLTVTVAMDSWQNRGTYNHEGSPAETDPAWITRQTKLPAITGCENLLGLYLPSIESQSETLETSAPTDFTLTLNEPESQGELAAPLPEQAEISLPDGFMINPSAANGLTSCSEAEAGITEPSAPSCPESSKVGSVNAESPLVSDEICAQGELAPSECPPGELRHQALEGNIYLAAKDANPLRAPLAVYVMINDRRTGVVIKLPAAIRLDAESGQVTIVISSLPQLPITTLRLHLYGGEAALLSTPADCGAYETLATLTPPTGASVTVQAHTQITEQCVNDFRPAIFAGTSTSQAGSTGALELTVSRTDHDAEISTLTLTTPPGLAPMLSTVTACQDPDAGAGHCGPSSQLGEGSIAAGTGSRPYWLKNIPIYLAGPYQHAPYSIELLANASIGPLSLGTILLRAPARIDPFTAQLIVTIGPLPTMIDPLGAAPTGIPLDLRNIEMTLNRPNLFRTPTSCDASAITTAAKSTDGRMIISDTPYQVRGCAELRFSPHMIATTAEHASYANGASLTIKLTQPPAGQSNLQQITLTLPRQLTGRLGTLQQACVALTFKARRDECPPHSIVGYANIHTPGLKQPLTGPVYFVSNGRRRKPELDLALESEGVQTTLAGTSSLDTRAHTTTIRFANIPDIPLESIEISFPRGRYSLLAANLPARARNSFCKQALKIKVSLAAHNGAALHFATPLNAAGCTLVRNKRLNTRPSRPRVGLNDPRAARPPNAPA